MVKDLAVLAVPSVQTCDEFTVQQEQANLLQCKLTITNYPLCASNTLRGHEGESEGGKHHGDMQES